MEKLLYHLRFSFRIFLKDKFFSALNVLGLAMGIAVGIIMVLLLRNDLAYDQHYAKHKNIYRLGAHYVIPDLDMKTGMTARELGPIVKDHYPEIEELVRVRELEHVLVKVEKNTFNEELVSHTEASYFRVFDHEFLEGDINTCLNDPNNVVLTESTAKKYFGDASAINKILTVNEKVRKVSAVISDHPDNTDLKFDILLAGLPELREGWDGTYENGKAINLVFWNPDVYTFLLLPDDYDVDNFYRRFQPIYDEYFSEIAKGTNNINDPILQPLDEVHFSGFSGEPSGNMTYLLAFAGIGVLIVLLACVNYMNLSTAKAVNRATEITMKRLAGSGRATLVASLIVESVLMSLISLVLAIGMVYFVINVSSFNLLIEKHLTLDLFNEPQVLLMSVGVALVIGVVSGIYPAFYLTAIPVVDSLKGKFKAGRSSLLMRKSLITFQFSVSMFVVLVTLFMSEQIKFARTKDLGFDKNNLLVVKVNNEETAKKIDGLTAELTSDPRIVSATTGQIVGTGSGMEQMLVETNEGMKQKGFLNLAVGDRYFETVGLKLIAGRKLIDGIDDDKAFIVNEAAVKMMGWGDDAIGKKMQFFMGHYPGTVVGVVKDFNLGSLHEAIKPMFIFKNHWETGFYQVRLTGEDIPGAVELVKQKWTTLEPEHPFEYFFLDEKYDEQYKADVTQNTLLSILSYVCIAISLLGLLGLAAFTAVQRTKEIGVRKVLGASVPGILLLLSKDILVLVIFAALIAIPVSWFVIDAWLESFAYRTPVSYLLYAFTILLSLAFVLFVTAFQSLKAASANPVDSLKYE